MLTRFALILITLSIAVSSFAEVKKYPMGEILSQNECTFGGVTLDAKDVDYTGFSEGSILLYLGSFGESTGLFVRRYALIRINKTVDEKGPYYYLHLKMYHNNAPIMPSEFDTRYTPPTIEGRDAYLVEFLKSPCSNLYRKKMKQIDALREMGVGQSTIDEYNERPWESCEGLAETEQLARSLDNLEIKVTPKQNPLRRDISDMQLRCNFLNF